MWAKHVGGHMYSWELGERVTAAERKPQRDGKKRSPGTYMVVQWLRLCAPNAGCLGSIPGQGTRSQMLQLRAGMPQLKILPTTTKTQGSQINEIILLKKKSQAMWLNQMTSDGGWPFRRQVSTPSAALEVFGSTPWYPDPVSPTAGGSYSWPLRESEVPKAGGLWSTRFKGQTTV